MTFLYVCVCAHGARVCAHVCACVLILPIPLLNLTSLSLVSTNTLDNLFPHSSQQLPCLFFLVISQV